VGTVAEDVVDVVVDVGGRVCDVVLDVADRVVDLEVVVELEDGGIVDVVDVTEVEVDEGGVELVEVVDGLIGGTGGVTPSELTISTATKFHWSSVGPSVPTNEIWSSSDGGTP
jgi:hypothetical protein